MVYFFIILSVWCSTAFGGIYLKDNLQKAERGDFIVTSQNKTYTILHVYEKDKNKLTLEEVSLPAQRAKAIGGSWRTWIQSGAPGHTSWMMYTINLLNGSVEKCFSFSKNRWCDPSATENFLGKLLNLHLKLVPLKERKRVGILTTSPAFDRRRLWQPKLIVDGMIIPGISFNAWRTRWPNDSSPLSGKKIEVYVPAENTPYPTYFPYWLQIYGGIGKAQLRVIDSGKGLISPKPSLTSLINEKL